MTAQQKEKGDLLQNSFKSSFWNSHIKSANVTTKERLLGYFVGPLGIMTIQSVVYSYFNQYITDVLGFTADKGMWIASFLVIFPLLSKLLDAVTNVIMAKIMDKTTCRQGKLRPWFILSLPIVIASCIALFAVPKLGLTIQAVWIVIAYIMFYTVGYTMWYMPYEMMAPLSTRNIKQRQKNSVAGQIAKNMGAGTVSILFPTALALIGRLTGGDSRSSYFYIMTIICCIAIPITFIQYFYTRERITEERKNEFGVVNAKAEEPIKEASFKEQAIHCFKDKYWIMLVIMVLLYQILNALHTISQVYYSGWVISGNQYRQFAKMQSSFAMIALAPMGPGIIAVLALYHKIGRRKTMILGSLITLIGSIIAYIGAGNRGFVYGGSAIGGLGSITFQFLLMTFIGDCIDHVEYSQHLRVEGFTAAFVGFAECFSRGIGQSIFNMGLSAAGYTTPIQIGTSASGVALFADQTAAATNWINFAYQGSFILDAILFFVLFAFFFKIDNELPTVHDWLQEKKKQECAAKGIEYIPAQELEHREIEEQEKAAEEIRIKELKEKCEKNGLDFEKENNAFLEKREKERAKKLARKEKHKKV